MEVKRNIFQTIVYEIETEFNDQSILSFINDKPFKKDKMLTTFFEYENILEDKNLINLKNHILNILNIFTKNVLKKKFFNLHTSWFQMYKINDYHDLHIHETEENCYSFIFYVQCSEDSSQTEFFMPGHPYARGPSFLISPKKSKIVLFPGHVPHQALSNNDEKRIILSGNFKVD